MARCSADSGGYPDFEVVTNGEGPDGFRLEAVLRSEGSGLRLETALKDYGRTVTTWSPSVGSLAEWGLLIDSTGDALVLASPKEAALIRKSLQTIATVRPSQVPVAVTRPPQSVRPKASPETRESIQRLRNGIPSDSATARRNRCCPGATVIQ